jgi:aminoglycoside N3'-acetyltransferase
MKTVKPPRWSVEHLTADLGHLGLTAGDLLMVHASLRAIGPVDEGADGVIDALEAAVAASGPLADKLLENVPWDDYYGPGSPLERFVQAKGRGLRLGADLDTLTMLHYAEYMAAIPSRRRVRRHRVLTLRDGPELRVVECLDDSDGIVDFPGEDSFAVILREYLATGAASTGVVGGATSEFIDAIDVVQFAVAWMSGHLASP